jgi:carbon storage regulator
MLVLTRKIGEIVWVGDVCVTVLEISGHKVRLGINAPRSVQIDRDEIRQRKLAQQKEEGGSDAASK